MRRLAILGSTGSIGTQTLEVVSAFPDQFRVDALAGGTNIERLSSQIIQFRPRLVSVANTIHELMIRELLSEHGINADVVSGPEGLVAVAEAEVEMVVMAVVGTASLRAAMAAIKSGTPIALANKEVLVSAGALIMAAARAKGVPVIPVDSEHAALKQCLSAVNEDMTQVSKLILTASGGPFRNLDQTAFNQIKVTDALRHPKWNMGPKITIDSATLMNKGLEVIEAHHLFKMPLEKIEVVVHPQSIIHSLVEFSDGTIMSQMGLPDMRFPIQYALTYPEKWPNPWPKTSLIDVSPLEFFKPDYERFPLLQLAYDCARMGGTAPAVMNAANEAVVGLFLNERIPFVDIPRVVSENVARFNHFEPRAIDDIVAVDAEVKHDIRAQFSLV